VRAKVTLPPGLSCARPPRQKPRRPALLAAQVAFSVAGAVAEVGTAVVGWVGAGTAGAVRGAAVVILITL
jgi:hypothetical protein